MRKPAISVSAAIALACALPSISRAVLPPYSLQFQVRAGGNADTLTTFSGNQVQINNNYTVASAMNNAGPNHEKGVWLGGGGSGTIVYAPESEFIGDISLNNHDVVTFAQSGASPSGIYYYDPSIGSVGLLTTGPAGASGLLSPKINDAGQVSFIANFAGGGKKYAVYDSSTGNKIYASNVAGDPSSPYCALSNPWIDGQGRVAGIVRIGPASQVNDNLAPDEVRRFSADGTYDVLARDMQSDANSQSFMFEAGTAPAMNQNGLAAYVSRTETCGCDWTRAVFLSDGLTTLTIAGPDDKVHRVQGFTPAVSDNGLVAFRGTDLDGLSAIYVGDGSSVERIVGVGDSLFTDLGPRVVGDLIGSPAIDGRGDLAFAVQFTSVSGGGTALYTAYVPEPATLGLVMMLSVACAARRRNQAAR